MSKKHNRREDTEEQSSSNESSDVYSEAQGNTESKEEKTITVRDFADIHAMNSADKGAVVLIYGNQKKTIEEWKQILQKDFIFKQS